MYLLSQLWSFLLIAFLLGALLGYLLWQYCGRRQVISEYSVVERRLASRIADVETSQTSKVGEIEALKLVESRLQTERNTLKREAFAASSERDRLKSELDDLEKKRISDRAELQRKWEEATKRELEELERKHAAALKQAEADAARKADARLAEETKRREELEKKHAAAIATAASDSDAKMQAFVLAEAKKTDASAVAAKQAAEAAAKKQLDDAKRKHADELKAAEADAKRQREEAEKKHAAALAAAVAVAASESEGKVQSLLSANTKKAETDSAAARRAAEDAAKKELEELKRAHAAELKAAERKTEERLAAAIKKREEETAAARKNAEEAGRKAASDAAQKRLEELEAKHASELKTARAAASEAQALLNSGRSEHEAKFKALQAEAEAARKQAGGSENKNRAISDQPRVYFAPRGGKADDLKLIWGVGEKIEQQMYRFGIYHFDQIAQWTARDVKWFEGHLPEFSERVEREKWVEQAKKLASGWRPEKSIGDRPDGVDSGSKPTVLSGPRNGKPDDLKLIWGVGPKLEDMLHKLGFYHFDQIAAWSKDQESWVASNLGDFAARVEKDKWVEQAKKLVTGWRPSKDAGDKPAGV